MQNVQLDETQPGIKISGRNINNLRYVDDTTLMAESEEELKSLLMKVKEQTDKTGLKLSIQKIKIMALPLCCPHIYSLRLCLYFCFPIRSSIPFFQKD